MAFAGGISSRLGPAGAIPIIAVDSASAALAVGTGAIVGCLLIWLDDLADLFPPMSLEGRR